MSKQIEALKLALEALAQIDEAMPFPVAKLAQKAIREALAQPEHGWTPERIAGMARLKDAQDKKLAQRTWVGLTDEEVNTIYEQAEVLVHDSWVGNGTVGLMFPITLYKMFEAKLKEKNNG